MSLNRTKKIAATTAAASLAVGGILLATAPAASTGRLSWVPRWCRFPSITP
ncbi:hypothetical protein ABIE52_000396 [Rhodococcus sp. OAS809]